MIAMCVYVPLQQVPQLMWQQMKQVWGQDCEHHSKGSTQLRQRGHSAVRPVLSQLAQGV